VLDCDRVPPCPPAEAGGLQSSGPRRGLRSVSFEACTRWAQALIAGLILASLLCATASAQETGVAEPSVPVAGPFERIPKLPFISGDEANRAETSTVVQIVVLMTVLTLAPSILMLMTCFTRVVIVLSFLSRALGTQQLPPNQVIVGLSLFLTFAVMSPVLSEANRTALQPYLSKEIDQREALHRAAQPFRRFMLSHTRRKDLAMFVGMDSKLAAEARAAGGSMSAERIPTLTIIPAFVLSELKVAFWMGFLLYLPFLIIDLVTASVLMSMGMMFLPPIMVSMPFKILLFVLVDGWYLVVGQLIQSIGPVT
jgi:flagellar biosynthetic protein FliP